MTLTNFKLFYFWEKKSLITIHLHVHIDIYILIWSVYRNWRWIVIRLFLKKKSTQPDVGLCREIIRFLIRGCLGSDLSFTFCGEKWRWKDRLQSQVKSRITPRNTWSRTQQKKKHGRGLPAGWAGCVSACDAPAAGRLRGLSVRARGAAWYI